MIEALEAVKVLKELLDMDAISADEYVSRKRQLLDIAVWPYFEGGE